jgi:hypothetical protein
MPTTEDFELLGCLVEADIKAGEPETFTLVARPGMGGYEFASRRGWPDEAPAPSHLRVDELEDFGWVRVTSSTAGKNRIFAVTSAGREGWNRYVAQQQHVPGYVDLDWTPAREVLERIYRLYRDRGAPERGVDTLPMASDPDDGKQVEALIRELLRADLLEDVRSSAAGPRFVRPSPETFRRLAGWPSGHRNRSAQRTRGGVQHSNPADGRRWGEVEIGGVARRLAWRGPSAIPVLG